MAENPFTIFLDFLVIQTAPEKFNGTNYLIWARRMDISLESQLLSDHLTTDEPAAAADAKIWKQKDAQSMSIMMDSAESDIRSAISDYPTAKKMWDYLRHTYWGCGDLFHKYDVCKRYFELKQGEKESVDEYTVGDRMVFYEFYLLFPLSRDPLVMAKRNNDIFLFKFMHGLRDEFEPYINQILWGKELPDRHQVLDILIDAEEELLTHLGGPQ